MCRFLGHYDRPYTPGSVPGDSYLSGVSVQSGTILVHFLPITNKLARELASALSKK